MSDARERLPPGSALLLFAPLHVFSSQLLLSAGSEKAELSDIDLAQLLINWRARQASQKRRAPDLVSTKCTAMPRPLQQLSLSKLVGFSHGECFACSAGYAIAICE